MSQSEVSQFAALLAWAQGSRESSPAISFNGHAIGAPGEATIDVLILNEQKENAVSEMRDRELSRLQEIDLVLEQAGLSVRPSMSGFSDEEITPRKKGDKSHSHIAMAGNRVPLPRKPLASDMSSSGYSLPYYDLYASLPKNAKMLARMFDNLLGAITTIPQSDSYNIAWGRITSYILHLNRGDPAALRARGLAYVIAHSIERYGLENSRMSSQLIEGPNFNRRIAEQFATAVSIAAYVPGVKRALELTTLQSSEAWQNGSYPNANLHGNGNGAHVHTQKPQYLNQPRNGRHAVPQARHHADGKRAEVILVPRVPIGLESVVTRYNPLQA